MQWPTFKITFRKALENNTILGLIAIGLLIMNIVQAVSLSRMRERVVLKPPSELPEQAVIGWDSASQNYLNSFAAYIVGTMSSATPGTVDFISRNMEPLFDPKIWQLVKPQLLAIKSNPNYIGVNPVSNFTPEGSIIFESKSRKIFIPGKLVSSAYSKGGMTQLGQVAVTYELQMEVVAGLPRVTSWYVYPGEPHTFAWADRYPDKAEKEAADRKAQIQVVPQVPESEITFPQAPSATAAASALSAPQGQPENPPTPFGKSSGAEQPPPAASVPAPAALPPAASGVQPTAPDDNPDVL